MAKGLPVWSRERWTASLEPCGALLTVMTVTRPPAVGKCTHASASNCGYSERSSGGAEDLRVGKRVRNKGRGACWRVSVGVVFMFAFIAHYHAS